MTSCENKDLPTSRSLLAKTESLTGMAWGLIIALLHMTCGLGWEEIHTRGPVVEVEEGPKASRILGLQRSLAKEEQWA